MGACIGSCVGGCAASCCCAACSKVCKPAKDTATRVPYMIVMFLSTVLALILRYWGKPLLVKVYWFEYELCESSRCLGFSAVYRVSFVVFAFFFMCALITQLGSKRWHTHFWMLKTLLLVVGLIAAFLIPNGFFDVYANIARFVSAIFLLLQIIILIDWAYAWNESWMADDKQRKIAILVVSVLMLISSLLILIFSFGWFAKGDCTRNEFFIGFTITLTTIFIVLSITDKVEHGALLPSAVVCLYCYYLLYSALASDPSTCNRLQSSNVLQVIIGIIIAGGTVTYASWNLSNSKSIFGEGEDDDEIGGGDSELERGGHQAADRDDHGHDSGGDDDDEEMEVTESVRKRNARFHWVMSATALYMAMLLTNYGVETNSSGAAYDLGDETVWIKMVTQWVTALLYIWSLVAPICLKNRDFS